MYFEKWIFESWISAKFWSRKFDTGLYILNQKHVKIQGFIPGGLGVPPSSKNFVNPPSDTCPRFWTKACPPPPPAEVGPRKFKKLKYIFASNLTTFKLKSTLKSCILH